MTARSKVALWIGIGVASLVLVVVLGLLRNNASSTSFGAVFQDGLGTLQDFALLIIAFLTGFSFNR